jgi:hypothetical protein
MADCRVHCVAHPAEDPLRAGYRECPRAREPLTPSDNRDDMLTQDPRQSTPRVRATPADPLHNENVQLVRGISQLRAALEAATRDNAALRRRLVHLEQENRRLSREATARPHPAHERRAHWQDALCECWSRNP